MRHGTGPFLIQQPALRRLLPNTSASKRLCKDAVPRPVPPNERLRETADTLLATAERCYRWRAALRTDRQSKRCCAWRKRARNVQMSCESRPEPSAARVRPTAR